MSNKNNTIPKLTPQQMRDTPLKGRYDIQFGPVVVHFNFTNLFEYGQVSRQSKVYLEKLIKGGVKATRRQVQVL